jgi:hypothetical protein
MLSYGFDVFLLTRRGWRLSDLLWAQRISFDKEKSRFKNHCIDFVRDKIGWTNVYLIECFLNSRINGLLPKFFSKIRCLWVVVPL